MPQQNSRNRNKPFEQTCPNSFRNFHSMHKQSSQWFKSGISNDATAYTLSPMDQSHFKSQKYDKNQKLHFSNVRQRRDDGKERQRNDINENKFTPDQDIGELLKNFEKPFWKILEMCSSKNRQLVRQCQQQYNYLKQILLHYPDHKHLGSYFNQMHIHSTDTKINLLKMLSKQQQKLKNKQQKLKDQQQQNQDLKSQIGKMKKNLKGKDQLLKEQIQKNRELENKIVGLADTILGLENQKKQLEGKKQKIKDQCQQLQEKQKKMKQDLKAKDAKIKDMETNKQNLQKQLDQIERKVQNCGLYEAQSNRPKSSKKIRFKSPKVEEEDAVPCQNSNISKGNKKDGIIEDDLFRFLFIQATTIQQDLLEQ